MKKTLLLALMLSWHAFSVHPVTEAIRNADTEKLRQLLNEGADPNERGLYPLHEVVDLGLQGNECAIQMAYLLLSKGADLEARMGDRLNPHWHLNMSIQHQIEQDLVNNVNREQMVA